MNFIHAWRRIFALQTTEKRSSQNRTKDFKLDFYVFDLVKNTLTYIFLDKTKQTMIIDDDEPLFIGSMCRTVVVLQKV